MKYDARIVQNLGWLACWDLKLAMEAKRTM